MSLTRRAFDSIQELLTMVPEHPPSVGLGGWTHAMREEWEGARSDAIAVMLELSLALADTGGATSNSAQRDPGDMASRAAMVIEEMIDAVAWSRVGDIDTIRALLLLVTDQGIRCRATDMLAELSRLPVVSGPPPVVVSGFAQVAAPTGSDERARQLGIEKP